MKLIWTPRVTSDWLSHFQRTSSDALKDAANSLLNRRVEEMQEQVPYVVLRCDHHQYIVLSVCLIFAANGQGWASSPAHRTAAAAAGTGMKRDLRKNVTINFSVGPEE